MAIAAFLDNPITGWATGCRKRLTEEGFNERRAVGAIILAAGFGSLILLLGLLLFRQSLWGFLDMEPVLLGVLFTGTVFFSTTIEIIRGTPQFGSTPWLYAGRDVLRVGIQISLVFLLADVLGMVLGITIANLLSVIIIFQVARIYPALPTRSDLRSIWKYAQSSIPNGLIGTTLSRMDILLLGALSTTEIVGNYQVAMNLTQPSMFLAGVMSTGLMSTVSNTVSRNVDPTSDIQYTISYASVFAIPIAIGALVVGDLVAVTVYGSQFREAGLFIGGLGIYQLFQSQVSVLTSVLSGFDRPDLNLRLNGISLIINLIFGIGLFFLIGPIGIVIGTVIGVIIRYIIAAKLVRKRVEVLLLTSPLQKQVFAGIVMGITVGAIRFGIEISGWIGVIGTISSGGMIYLLTISVISEHFRETIRGIINDVIG